MRIDEKAKEQLIADLETVKRNYTRWFDIVLESLKGALSVEYATFLMRELLYGLVDSLPLPPKVGYFCLALNERCHICPYGKAHGRCLSEGSDLYKLREHQERLKRAFVQYYHRNGEYYGEEEGSGV